MRKILFVVCLIVFQFSVAQNAKLIIGKWVYSGMHDPSDMDEEGRQLAERFFKDFTLNFRDDATTTLVMMGKPENGRYEFDRSDANKVSVTSEKGSINTFRITKVDDKQLIISMGDRNAMVMNKVSATPDAMIAKTATAKVAATAKQLIAKWDVDDIEKEKKSELFQELLKGSYIEFFEDGTYQTKVLGIEEYGEWELTQGRTVIEVETEDDKGFWNILAISDTELTMQRGTEGKKYFFKKAVE